MHNKRQPRAIIRDTRFGQRLGKNPTKGKILSKFFFYYIVIKCLVERYNVPIHQQWVKGQQIWLSKYTNQYLMRDGPKRKIWSKVKVYNFLSK